MKRKGILGIFLFAFIFIIGMPRASANSAIKEYHGTSSADILIKDDECPIEVLKENLTVHIKNSPVLYSEESFLNYGNYVEAAYTLYNPMDYDESLTLVFPFNPIPEYYDLGLSADYSKYSILLNSVPVDKRIRYTYLEGEFRTDGQLDKLSDAYRTDSFYSPDLTVYKYSYQASYEDLDSLLCQCTFKFSDKLTKILGNGSYQGQKTNYEGVYQCYPDEDGNIEIYVLGNDVEFNWEFFKSRYYGEGSSTEADIRLISKTETTFIEYVLSLLPETGDILETDWYNIVVDYMNSYNDVKLYPLYYDAVYRYVLRWYEYSITVPAKGTVIHEVTAPIYPLIVDEYFTPAVYEYRYFLSPAAMWADFSDLTIVIDTPFYMLNSSLSGFEEKEEGFVFYSQSLPAGELSFTLCESLSPKRESSPFLILLIILAALFFGLIVVFFIVLVVFVIIWATSKYKSAAIRINRMEILAMYLSMAAFILSMITGAERLGYAGYALFILTAGLTVYDSIRYKKYFILRLTVCGLAVLLGGILFIGCIASKDDLYYYFHSVMAVLNIAFGIFYIIFGILNIECRKKDMFAEERARKEVRIENAECKSHDTP